MIKATEVQHYHGLCALIKESEKALKELKVERDDRETKIIAAVKNRERVEASCAFRVLVEFDVEKTFSPPYKKCAIELTSEAQVSEWVKQHNPHEKEDRLKLVAKKFGQAKLPKKFAEAVDGLLRLVKAA
jgi:hypothetical protein